MQENSRHADARRAAVTIVTIVVFQDGSDGPIRPPASQARRTRTPPQRPAAVAEHCKQSTTVDDRPEGRDPSHKRHALRLSSVGPEPREPGCNSPEPRLQTYLPRHLRRPVPTHADAPPREVRRRRDACPEPRSVRIRKPRAARRPPAESRREHC